VDGVWLPLAVETASAFLFLDFIVPLAAPPAVLEDAAGESRRLLLWWLSLGVLYWALLWCLASSAGGSGFRDAAPPERCVAAGVAVVALVNEDCLAAAFLASSSR
jgi:hypothetical protein